MGIDPGAKRRFSVVTQIAQKTDAEGVSRRTTMAGDDSSDHFFCKLFALKSPRNVDHNLFPEIKNFRRMEEQTTEAHIADCHICLVFLRNDFRLASKGNPYMHSFIVHPWLIP